MGSLHQRRAFCPADLLGRCSTSLLGGVGASLLGSGSMKMEEWYLHTFRLPERWALLKTSLRIKRKVISFSHDGARGQSEPEGE